MRLTAASSSSMVARRRRRWRAGGGEVGEGFPSRPSNPPPNYPVAAPTRARNRASAQRGAGMSSRRSNKKARGDSQYFTTTKKGAEAAPYPRLPRRALTRGAAAHAPQARSMS